MLSSELYEEGIRYATGNFTNDSGGHLGVDKQLIRELFPLDGCRVLDIGCGMGGMTLWYAKHFDCEVLGCDVDAHHIAIAQVVQSRFGVQNVTFEKRDVLHDPPAGPFDFIVMNDVAEHIPLPVLKEMLNLLPALMQRGSKLFISYPPWHGPYASHVQHVLGLPWCQFLPEPLLLLWIARKNRPIVGNLESDLLSAYKGLNRLTHRKLAAALAETGLKQIFRKSHSIVNKLPFCGSVQCRVFPFHFLVSKEFLVLERP